MLHLVSKFSFGWWGEEDFLLGYGLKLYLVGVMGLTLLGLVLLIKLIFHLKICSRIKVEINLVFWSHLSTATS
jgi:hypothetical protein